MRTAIQKSETTFKKYFILLFIKVSGIASAAPPLVTDDAATVPEGAWEYILSTSGESRPAVDAAELPALEISYGLTESLQLTAAMARQVIEERGGSSRSGWGYGEVAAKWQFYAEDSAALAVAPAYTFPVSGSSKLRGLVEDVRVLSLPLVGTLSVNSWEFSAQLGLDITSTSTNGIGYGFAGGYALTETFTLLAEVYGEELSGDEDDLEDFTNWRAGFSWEFIPAFTLLAAWGGDIESDLPADDQLDYEYFLGLQYETP